MDMDMDTTDPDPAAIAQFSLNVFAQRRQNKTRTVDVTEFVNRITDILDWCPPPLSLSEPLESQDAMAFAFPDPDLLNRTTSASGYEFPPTTTGAEYTETALTERAQVQTLTETGRNTNKPGGASPVKKKSLYRPQFYDRHLDETLVVKDVVLLDGLLMCISDLADRYTKDLLLTGQLPQEAELLPTFMELDRSNTRTRTLPVLSEGGISQNFAQGAALHCPPLASALVLHPKHWVTPLVSWQIDVLRKKWAIADGALQFAPELRRPQLSRSSAYRPVLDTMREDLKRLLPTMVERFNPMAVWEFKSLTVGDDTVMKEIIEMGSEKKHFHWLFCSKLRNKSVNTQHCHSEAEGPETGEGNPAVQKLEAEKGPVSQVNKGRKRKATGNDTQNLDVQERRNPKRTRGQEEETGPTVSETPSTGPNHETEKVTIPKGNGRRKRKAETPAVESHPSEQPPETRGKTNTTSDGRKKQKTSPVIGEDILSEHDPKARGRLNPKKKNGGKRQTATSSSGRTSKVQNLGTAGKVDSKILASATVEVSQIPHSPKTRRAATSEPTDKKTKTEKKETCPNHDVKMEEMIRVTKRGPGVDARNPPWKDLLPACNSPPNHLLLHLQKVTLSGENGCKEKLSPSNNPSRVDEEIISPTEEPEVQVPGSEQQLALVDDLDDCDSDDDKLVDVDPAIEVVEGLHPEAQNGNGLDPSERQRRPRKEVNAQAIIQQAWAEAVRNQCSILVIHSGNHEIIGIRHRKSQTLYITELIHPYKPPQGLGYGKIQVGLNICAILDVIDRAQQFEEQQAEKVRATREAASAGEPGPGEAGGENQSKPEPPPPGRDDSAGGKGSSTGNPHSGVKHGGRSASGNSLKGCANECLETLLNMAKARNLVFLYLRYGFYNSPVPAPFMRYGYSPPGSSSVPTSQSPGESISIPSSEESIDLILTSEKAAYSTGIVHIGVMEFSGHPGNISVAAKLGFTTQEKKTLQKECALYSQLHQEGVKGVPECIGLFMDLDRYEEETTVEGPYALVMRNAGHSLYQKAHTLPKNAKLSLILTLNSMHSAGILHGDIRDTNLCRLNDNEVFIIDLSHASQAPDAEEKADELASLCELLQLDLKEAQEAILASQLTPEKPEQDGQERPGLRRSARLKNKNEQSSHQSATVQVHGNLKQESDPEVIQAPRRSHRLKEKEVQKRELLAKETRIPRGKDDGPGKNPRTSRKSAADTRKQRKAPKIPQKLTSLLSGLYALERVMTNRHTRAQEQKGPEPLRHTHRVQ